MKMDNLFEKPKNYENALRNTLVSCYIIGEKNPYYKYFLTSENEKKENMLLLHKNIKNDLYIKASFAFLSYNLIKSILWRKGYFAYFFYHTRGMSPALYFIYMYYINEDFKASLQNDNILRYFEKRNQFLEVEGNIAANLVAKEKIEQKI